MKNTVLTMIVGFSAALFLLLAPVSAYADAGTLGCYYGEMFTYDNCDLSLDKQVKVNNGPSVEAPTAAQAVTAHVGDTLTWTVTVSNTSVNPVNGQYELLPDGTVTVSDILPSQVKLDSYTITGDPDSTYADGVWTISVADNLPSTLTIVTTATSTGLIENTASFSGYTPPCYAVNTCLDPAYNDANSSNNTASAFVNIPGAVTPAAVAVPATPAAPNTGFGASFKNPWSSLWILPAAAALFAAGLKIRRAASN
jgi:uncharacterized repeat protein (TIGR01451 family)